MAQQPRSILKSYFETGDYPTQEQFSDLIDSFFNQSNDGSVTLSVGKLTVGSPILDTSNYFECDGPARFFGISLNSIVGSGDYEPTIGDNTITLTSSCDIFLNGTTFDTNHLFCIKSLNGSTVNLIPDNGNIDGNSSYAITGGTIWVQWDVNSQMWLILSVSNF